MDNKQYRLRNVDLGVINYMTIFHNDWDFIKFVPVIGENFGLGLEDTKNEDISAYSLFLSQYPSTEIEADDPKEQELIDAGCHWVALLLGTDNSSIMIRFKDKHVRYLWSRKKIQNPVDWPNRLFYNS